MPRLSNSMTRAKSAKERDARRRLPERLNIGDKTWDEQQVPRPISNDLVGDMDVITFDVVSDWDVSHARLLRDKTAQQESCT